MGEKKPEDTRSPAPQLAARDHKGEKTAAQHPPLHADTYWLLSRLPSHSGPFHSVPSVTERDVQTVCFSDKASPLWVPQSLSLQTQSLAAMGFARTASPGGVLLAWKLSALPSASLASPTAPTVGLTAA